jgi:hypothetical protein
MAGHPRVTRDTTRLSKINGSTRFRPKPVKYKLKPANFVLCSCRVHGSCQNCHPNLLPSPMGDLIHGLKRDANLQWVADLRGRGRRKGFS